MLRQIFLDILNLHNAINNAKYAESGSLQDDSLTSSTESYCGDGSHGTGYVFRGYPLGQSFLDSKGSLRH